MDYTFLDFRKQGVPTKLLPDWIDAVGLVTLINRKDPIRRNHGAGCSAGLAPARCPYISVNFSVDSL